MRTSSFATLFVATSLSLAGCPDDKKVPLGGTCGGDSECAQGECIANLCLDPDGDEDGDGLSNRLEATLGTNPLNADTDGDGIPDGEEIGDISNPTDTDGDGKPDAIESSTADADSDCIADQFDPDDANPETDPAALGAAICSKVGVCGADGAVVTATCPADLVPVCDYSQAPQYQAVETACDGVDNDCDGETDENQAAGGSVTFDGGGFAGDAGKVLGDGCGTGACAGGTVVCAVDMASLVCTTSDRVGVPTCGADNDCNGTDDLADVADPLTTELAGCSAHFVDGDDDGVGGDAELCLCAPAGDYTVTVGGDCDDDDDTRFPGNTAPLCGVDADCDGALLDVGEACDDGNDVATDGCHECGVVGLEVGGRGGSAFPHAVVNLTDGGFVVSWNEGYSLSERWQGRALAFYDRRGVEVARVDGIGVEDIFEFERATLVALPGGGIAYVYQEFDGELWSLRSQRYSSSGAAIGDAVEIASLFETAWDFGVVATGPSEYLAWWFTYGIRSETTLNMRHVDAAGVPSDEPIDITFLSGEEPNHFQVMSFPSGELLAFWSQWLIFENGESPIYFQRMTAQRLDKFGAPSADPTIVELGSEDRFEPRLALRDNGWAIFFLENTYDPETQDRFTSAGFLSYSATDTQVGEATYVTRNDPDGCPYEVFGGFDEAGHAYTILADGECRSPLRGHVLVDGTPVALELGADALVARYTEGVAATRTGPLTVAYNWADERTGLGALVLYRFSAGAIPTYIPGPPPLDL